LKEAVRPENHDQVVVHAYEEEEMTEFADALPGTLPCPVGQGFMASFFTGQDRAGRSGHVLEAGQAIRAGQGEKI
jgi:hypothetical protein